MRNSRAKLNRNTIANPFTPHPNSQNHPCPQAYDQNRQKTTIKTNTFESNYNFFMSKMGTPVKTIERQAHQTHQRFASMGNSRIIGSATAGQQISNSASTPYLQFNAKQYRTQEQTSKAASRNEPTLAKNSNKLSMRNVFKDYGNSYDNYSCVKESEASTFHETVNTVSKSQQDKIKNDQIYKYFQSKLQKSISQLKNQQTQQTLTINSLQSLITNLNNKLKQKQQTILQLQSQIYCKKQYNTIYINKLNMIQKLLNETLNNKIKEQDSIQEKLNNKFEHLMGFVMKLMESRNYGGTNLDIGKNLKAATNILKENKATIQQLSSLNKIVSTIKNHTSAIKTTLSQPQPLPPPPNPQLNDSTSYFFHPSQLSNIQKFTQLFHNRQGQPIQCYTDNKNQVRYRDTGTFMYNRKGDVVTLTENQKRYYVDKGFIATTSY